VLKFFALKVAAAHLECEEAVTVALEVPAELASEFQHRPGQHLVVRAQLPGGEVRRTYSLVSAPGETPLKLSVRVQPGGRLSPRLAALVPGALLEVMPPNGSFGARVIPRSNATYVAFAAGSGITPVFSLLAAILSGEPTAQVLLFYGNRTASRTMLLEELLALKDRHLERLALHFIMSREPQEIALLNGRIDAGKVRAAAALFDPARVSEFFVCGPGSMIEEVSAALIELGVARARVHAERFTLADAEERHAPVEPRAATPTPPAAQAELTRVTLTMDGRRRSFTMRRDGASVLDAAARAGLELPFSCKAGVCSTCRTRLVRGEVRLAHNYALEDWELAQGFILACQAQPKSAEIELNYDEI